MKTLTLSENKIVLPEGFALRGATLEDVPAVIELFNRWSQAVVHENEFSDPAPIRQEWISPGFDPAEDIRLIFAPNGTLVGYIEVWTTNKPPVHPWIWGRVDPQYEGLGLGSALMSWAEARAHRVLPELDPALRFSLRVGTFREAVAAKHLFGELGYRPIRGSYTMRIELPAPLAAPTWPEGFTLRSYNPETDLEAVYRADDEAFRDHFGHQEVPFEEGLQRFKHFMTDYQGFDPSLWFLAMDGDQVAGICLCRLEAMGDPQVGWVNILAVRRPWRKRGLGLALLQHAFGELYRRGQRQAGLGVDAENLTGALRLYENAGMHVHRAFELFEKELRPGREISVQSL